MLAMAKSYILLLTVCLGLVSCAKPAQDQGAGNLQQAPASSAAQSGNVTDARIAAAVDQDIEQWLTHDQFFAGHRYSKLRQINRDTVQRLGIAWYKELGGLFRAQAVPLVVDGVMYVSDPWNLTYALDAKTGEEIWSFDPQTNREYIQWACCGSPLSRGVAVYQGMVFLATFDARMIALDAATGKKIWEVDTYHPSAGNRFTITAAPRVGGGKVYIGQSSSEYGVRGYVSAYDADTGDLAWRFYLVPGDPAKPFEHPAMELAAKTWTGEWWKYGAGGTVWNAIAYDPEFQTLYLGVGNGAPWPRKIRSPGGGDNLFLTAIVAVDAASGQRKWHYQTVPGDNWDYSAAMDMVLADLRIDGETRKVLMQAPKNGFFYVLDRANGELLRANKFAAVQWATHVDMATGRPVEDPGMAYENDPKWVLPGAGGAHSWQGMSFDAARGVMYLPTHDAPFFYGLAQEFVEEGRFAMNPVGQTLGLAVGAYREQLVQAAGPVPESIGYLKAFDPLTGEVLWKVRNTISVGNSGVLATDGGLVFQGDRTGHIYAYDKLDGRELWRYQTHGSATANPITFAVDGVQYYAQVVGANRRHADSGKLMVFKLDGDVRLPPPTPRDLSMPEPPPLTATLAELEEGDRLYHEVCANCHGSLGRSSILAQRIVDLRRMAPQTHEQFTAIVLAGVRKELGMPGYANKISFREADMIHQFIIQKATQAYEREQATVLADVRG